jgi:hypothetical protein
MVLKWKDKGNVSIISSFHDLGMAAAKLTGSVLIKLRCVVEYNHDMGGVDLKDQKLQPHLFERERGLKWVHKSV